MRIEEMIDRKKELGLTNQTLSEKSGVPLGTVQKIFAGLTKAPREETIRALEKVLAKAETVSERPFFVDAPGEVPVFRETASAYGKKKSYTLQDYLALPDGVRKELIDGVFYDMGEPATIHQALAGFIHRLLLNYVLEKKGLCMPLVSPCAVQLDCDDKTVVEPDIFVVCDRSKFVDRRVFGAPDLVIEVLSPSTKRKDSGLKLYKYLEAGVREYWMIDPWKKVIVVYEFERDLPPHIYGFEDTVPVGIWEGACKVDFKEILEQVSFLYN